MNEAAAKVLDLLTYIEQAEKLKAKPAFAVPSEYFVAHQQELQSLPELQFNLQQDGDDLWLRFPRLQEIAAPEPDEVLKPWVNLPKSPEKNPELRVELALVEGKRQIGKELLANRPDVRELFDWYVEFQWAPWAAAERPRRKAIARYKELFALQQTFGLEGAEAPLELVWGIGFAAWKKEGYATPVKHPMLVQACEVVLNDKNFDLEVRPRDVPPRLEVDCYAEMELPGVRPLEAFWKSTLTTGAHRVNPFEDSTFDSVLKAAVGHLDPSGAYEARVHDVSVPAPGEKLKVTNTWVLFGRKRNADIFLEDVRRLKLKVEAADSIPNVIRSFVEHGDTTVRARAEQPFRGLSSSDSAPGAFELFFPMPYNDEQVSIIQKLESNDGVVVQGPPGTGKTHTIANVICHYLAQGKRVLVTAKGESALSVLQEKLPERIRPLSVSLLSDERDGMKQFEHSIQTIASSVASLNPGRAHASIAAAQEKLDQLHAKISHVDRTVSEFAGRHMRQYTFQGRPVSPEEMAKLVLVEADQHQWFDDSPPPTKDGAISVTDADIVALRTARIAAGQDLAYLPHKLPEPGDFPSWPDLLALHRDLVKARTIETNVSHGKLLAMVDSQMATFESAQTLSAFLQERSTVTARLAEAKLTWLDALGVRVRDMQSSDPLLAALQSVCSDVRSLEARRRDLVTRAVSLPVDAELNEDFIEALDRLVAGKSAFALPFGRGDARKLVAAVAVLGSAPANAQAWELVKRLVQWRVEARKVVARWNALSGEFALEEASVVVDVGFKAIAAAEPRVEDMHRLVFSFDAELASHMKKVFGQSGADRLFAEGEPFVPTIVSSLQAHLDKGRLAYAMKRVQELLGKLDGCGGSITEQIQLFLVEQLGRSAAEEGLLQPAWMALQAELSRLTRLRPSFGDIATVTHQLETAGATAWAERARTIPAGHDSDPVTPSSWLEAWNWRQAVMFLDRIDGHHRMRELFLERKTLTTALARTYQELVAEKTWLGVYNNSPDNVRQALQAYLNAVQAMGAGTGVRAIRHRKTARDAMVRAYQAVPCWVLPQWRVSETIPAELELFDLVVVDEASQSDIWALPALLRGKKLLVVGDHKQVSPSAVGAAEERIKELTGRFLGNQPHGSEMTPDKSIYDLARVVFAGNSVMLKEHFRCVPAIIEFSNREFYQGDIKPLRLPKANERLDPPLIDVYVKGGGRDGDLNRAEAKAIIDEIKAVLLDPALAGRSIGVVTLMGMAQAAHIQELVSSQISPVDVVARKIAVGPPPVFQGRERDIMMVSMVLGPGDRAAQNKADMLQRFNVALSRARDRMYLFRSVTETTFKEDTLNSRLIRHFRQPFLQDARKVEALRDKCESGFEQEMFDELTERGYRVEPQVPCGGYRIDFVVEGNEGRRLAVECDGDRFHGPGQWQDDMVRQRVLERAGWTFWRCFASSFVRRRELVVNDLLDTLQKLGIEPVGAESVDNTVWAISKEVDPYGVDVEEDAEQEVL